MDSHLDNSYYKNPQNLVSNIFVRYWRQWLLLNKDNFQSIQMCWADCPLQRSWTVYNKTTVVCLLQEGDRVQLITFFMSTKLPFFLFKFRQGWWFKYCSDISDNSTDPVVRSWNSFSLGHLCFSHFISTMENRMDFKLFIFLRENQNLTTMHWNKNYLILLRNLRSQWVYCAIGTVQQKFLEGL